MPIQSSRVSMTPGNKRVVVGQKREDRISELPINVKDRILELLPVEDAARTSILSKKWRCIWAKLPNLGLNAYAKSLAVFKEIVDTILLKHRGAILKFHLDVSGLRALTYAHMDRWMSYVTRNGVKELCLRMSYNSTYILPSYVLDCLTLTHLELFYCFFKSPHSFVGFQHLIDLRLQEITFKPSTEFCVINCPLLVNLALVDCYDTQYLKIIVSSTLEHLIGYWCPGLNLNLFVNCKGLRKLQLEIAKVVTNPIPEHDERATLVKFVLSVAATLEFLQMNFRSLEEWGLAYNADTVLEYLDRPITCFDLRLNKLKYVAFDSYEWSKTELLFVKLLLACVPSLERMCIELEKDIGFSNERNFIKKLLYFPRASPSIFRFRILRNKTCTAYVLD